MTGFDRISVSALFGAFSWAFFAKIIGSDYVLWFAAFGAIAGAALQFLQVYELLGKSNWPYLVIEFSMFAVFPLLILSGAVEHVVQPYRCELHKGVNYGRWYFCPACNAKKCRNCSDWCTCGYREARQLTLAE